MTTTFGDTEAGRLRVRCQILLPNQQCQSTEGTGHHLELIVGK